MIIITLLIVLSLLITSILFGRTLRKMFNANKTEWVFESDFGTFSHFFFLSAFACGFFLCFAIVGTMVEGPKAIDVYRNKTELRITSVNGVTTDTVVVWKGEVYEDIK